MENGTLRPLNIGQIIEAEVRKQQISISEFVRRISTDRRNVYNIFRRVNIDCELLRKISVALGHDFFSDYSKHIKKIIK